MGTALEFTRLGQLRTTGTCAMISWEPTSAYDAQMAYRKYILYSVYARAGVRTHWPRLATIKRHDDATACQGRTGSNEVSQRARVYFFFSPRIYWCNPGRYSTCLTETLYPYALYGARRVCCAHIWRKQTHDMISSRLLGASSSLPYSTCSSSLVWKLALSNIRKLALSEKRRQIRLSASLIR
jgi:hypothetical protein